MKEIAIWRARFLKIMEERFQQLDEVLLTLKDRKNESIIRLPRR